jgi:hypothetical protein
MHGEDVYYYFPVVGGGGAGRESTLLYLGNSVDSPQFLKFKISRLKATTLQSSRSKSSVSDLQDFANNAFKGACIEGFVDF